MRSSSEIKAVRVRNTVGQRVKVSAWHTIVPGVSADAPSPGVACRTELSGSIQFETWEGVQTREGDRHVPCFAAARRWIANLPTSPNDMNPEPERERLAGPGRGNW